MAAGALPNLVVIGGMKCGTTSFHEYLRLHPSISMSKRKELHYFLGGGSWDRGEEWYRSWFDPDRPVRGETSPGYTNFPMKPGVPQRMHALIPDARLIYLVRDPVERTLSHYRHMVAERREHRPLQEVLADPSETYTQRSRFHFQLEQYLPFYAIEQILVVQQESLLNDRVRTLERVFGWLGVDPRVRSLRFLFRRHRSDRKRRLTDFGLRVSRTAPMRAVSRAPDPLRFMLQDMVYRPVSRAVDKPRLEPEMLANLKDRLREDAARLRRLTGQAFDEWSV